MLSIGKMARMLGVTPKAIKHYEEVGLFKPAYINPETGYRYYTNEERKQLQQIRDLRRFGVPISKIKNVGRSGVKVLLEEHLQTIRNEIELLQQTKEAIKVFLNKEETLMQTRIETIEEFSVTGYKHVGSTAEIPKIWDKLNRKLSSENCTAEEYFGVCLSFDENHELHYIAGIDHLSMEPDMEEVKCEGGRYLVAKVEGGIPAISKTYEALIETPNMQFRSVPDFEKYIHPDGENEHEIEIWLPIV